MAIASDTSELIPQSLTPDALFKAPLGFVSPLWGVFSGAALTGVAWWWATQWMRSPLMAAALDKTEELVAEVPLMIEAATAQVVEPAVAVAETVVETTVEAAELVAAVVEDAADTFVAATEAAVEPLVTASEQMLEAASEPIIEMVVDAELPETVVGGEAAPIPPAALASVEEASAPPAPKPAAAPRAKAASAAKVS